MRTVIKTAGFALLLTTTLLWEIGAYAGGPHIPHFNLVSVDGQRYTEEGLAGHPTLIVFWAPWCAVCRHELPEVSDLYGRLKRSGLQVISIGFADDKENIDNYVQAHPDTFTFPVLYDPQNRAAKRFGVIGTPTIYLFNQQGELELQTWLIEDTRLESKLNILLER